MFHELDDQFGLAQILNATGEFARLSGDEDSARRAYTASLAIYERLGDIRAQYSMLYNLAFVAQHEGNHAEAIRILLESLALCQELGVPAEVANELLAIAGSLGAVGDLVGAARLLGAADAFLQQSGALLDPNDQPEHDRNITFVRTALGAAAFAAAWAEGQDMTLDQAVAYMRSATGADSQSAARPAPDENDKLPGDLTRRESEVARLIAKGLSNREIAAALVISERTVANHLSHIFTKIEVNNRAAAAAFAFRHRLA